MKITLDKIGKKYNREWIFRGINLELTSLNSYAVTGNNGSGKSTFLQLISGFKSPSEGTLIYHKNKHKALTPVGLIYKDVSYVAPYISVFEEYTIKELIDFYTKLKPLRENIKYDDFLKITELEHAKEKKISAFSSGMKQRVKLALAILSDTQILLLDEPTSNLDEKAVEWYQNLIKKNTEDRLILVATNNKTKEAFFCDGEIKIQDYK